MYFINKSEVGETLVSCIINYRKDKIIQYIEENGLPVVNIFKDENDEQLEQEHTMTPRFQEPLNILGKISFKEVFC